MYSGSTSIYSAASTFALVSACAPASTSAFAWALSPCPGPLTVTTVMPSCVPWPSYMPLLLLSPTPLP